MRKIFSFDGWWILVAIVNLSIDEDDRVRGDFDEADD
jgi:hypothetical protein